MKINAFIIIACFLLIGTFISSYFIFIKQEATPVYGTYRPYSSDPQLAVLYKNQNTRLLVKEDHLIIYSTFLMGRPLHNIQGAFTINSNTNTLNINWFGGKLPKHLKVEQDGEDYFIRIGETIYKKEKEKG